MKQNISKQTEAARVKCLACAPGIIFLLVASADGNIDKKELKRFATLMASKDYAILTSMLDQAGATIPDLLDEVLLHDLDPYQELQSVCSILDIYLSEKAAETYKVTLYRLARGIARSSAGLFGFLGARISQEQEAATMVVAKLLGLLDEREQQYPDEDMIGLA